MNWSGCDRNQSQPIQRTLSLEELMKGRPVAASEDVWIRLPPSYKSSVLPLWQTVQAKSSFRTPYVAKVG